MSPTPRWIAISAASALGLGIMATGAVGIANAMPLVDSTTTATVPPISTVPGHGLSDVKGSGGMGVTSVPVPSPNPTAIIDPTISATETPGTTTPGTTTPGVQAPPAPQAPAPVPPVAPNTVSVVTPASVDSVD
jgi:hypothetical protein